MTAPGNQGGSAGARAPADVVVVGAGLIGLASAAALAVRGARVILMADVRRGESSPAAAGMLAPSVERGAGAAHEFAIAARDRFPAYVAWLAAETGIEVPLNRLGVLRLALDEAEADAVREPAMGGASWLAPAELAELEPTLSHASGALHHPHDGAVNNLVLMRALKTVVGRSPRVRIVNDAAAEMAFDAAGVAVRGEMGSLYAASQLVLAAGAWAPFVAGLPRPLPIEPVRGQMLSLAAAPLRHVVYGAGGYVVPRPDGRTLVGTTMERVAFDAATTAEGIGEVRRIGNSICPALAGARMLNGWAGLRPVTPDLLPLLGRDPTRPALIYACGHSRNGVLLAPLTGECVAALADDSPPPFDLAPFAPTRFAGG